MQRKAPRRTRERILETALTLFNTHGEPNVTTAALAEALNISPGNLYYHFRNKDDIVHALFDAFEQDIAPLLQVDGNTPRNVEDLWLFLHLLFETIWRHRFIYRDLNDLMARNRRVRLRMRAILERKTLAARNLCEDLILGGQLRISPLSADALATNIVVVATGWLAFQYAWLGDRMADPGVQAQALSRGAFQVAALAGAYLHGDAARLFEQLAQAYLPERTIDHGWPPRQR
jgi:AcrR family transcriptional regulator